MLLYSILYAGRLFQAWKMPLGFVPAECLFRHFPGISSSRYTSNQVHLEMVWNQFCSGRIFLLSNCHNKTNGRLNGLLSLCSACQAQGWATLPWSCLCPCFSHVKHCKQHTEHSASCRWLSVSVQ